MRKLKIMLVFFLLIGVTVMFAANNVQLVSSTGDETILKFKISTYQFKKVMTPRGEAVELIVPKTGRILEQGAPDLPRMATSVIIPDRAKMRVEVIDAKFFEIDNVLIAPSKGNLLRNIDPAKVPYTFGAKYDTNAFYPANLADTRTPYIARDFRGQAILVHPFMYNPVTRTLRVYNKIVVKVSDSGETGKNILVRTRALKEINTEFRKVYARHFLNYDSVISRYTPLGDNVGNMLIVCYNGFLGNMADFVNWKESIGYSVDLVDYSAIGSAAALKTYVANYYNTNGLTFLLLVGDNAQVPVSSTTAGDSDNNYGYIVGSDHYQDIFVGRFSAETTAHVDTQVGRTIWYERDLASSATWFRHTTGMGTSEGPGHNGEYDYQHINLLLADLAAYGYTTYTNHQSGGTTANLTNLINSGQGTLWYCGHGNIDGWYCGWTFLNAQVAALTNDNMLPAVFSVACQVGNFKSYTCFCEYWLRETNGSNYAGAIAHAGSTINQSWNPPMDAEDEMVDLLVAGKRTFGGVFVNGMFKMNDINGTAGYDMTDTWVCFGDSSVQLRTPGTPNGPIGGNQAPTADFTYTTNLLQVTFTDQSTDPDGTIVAWNWDFGDGAASTVQNPIHNYLTNGTYNVTLTVTDDDGATDSITKPVTVSDGTEPEMFVYSIVQTITKKGKSYSSKAVVTIRDTNNSPVTSAAVYITWSGVVSGSASGVTGSGGTYSFTSGTSKNTGPFTITVTNVTHATLTYNPALNNETSDTAYF